MVLTKEMYPKRLDCDLQVIVTNEYLLGNKINRINIRSLLMWVLNAQIVCVNENNIK